MTTGTSPLPAPVDHSLLEQLRLSLGSHQSFLWRQRLLTERLMRNITMPHARVLEYVRDLIEAGHDQPSHGELVEALGFGISTVKDALGRGRKLGLIDWEHQYAVLPDGYRRQHTNRYRLCMPEQSPQPRPDIRRHRLPRAREQSSSSNNLLPTWSPDSGERGGHPPAGFVALQQARIIAHVAASKRLRVARTARRPP